MASTPQPVSAQIDDAATDLYEAFVEGGATRAMVVSLDFTNVTDSDLTLDVWVEGGGVSRYLCNRLPIPARESAQWRGMVTIKDDTYKLRGLSTVATSVDVLGTVVENA